VVHVALDSGAGCVATPGAQRRGHARGAANVAYVTSVRAGAWLTATVGGQVYARLWCVRFSFVSVHRSDWPGSYSTSSPVSTGMGDVYGFNSRRRHFISVCNQPLRSTQPFILSRAIN